MGRESRPDLVDRIDPKFRTPRQRVGALSDRDVVAKHAEHDTIVGIPVGSIGRKEHLLFETEVPAPVRHPIAREHPARLRSGLVAGTREPLGYHQYLMVIAR
jgi:hypothetical protein